MNFLRSNLFVFGVLLLGCVYGHAAACSLAVSYEINKAQAKTAIFKAISENDVDAFKDWMLAIDLQTCDSLGQPPLYVACLSGRKEIVELLLPYLQKLCETKKVQTSRGVRYATLDDMRVGPSGETALHAVARTGNGEITELLLRCGMSRCIQNIAHLTPMQLAETCGHPDLVRLLRPLSERAIAEQAVREAQAKRTAEVGSSSQEPVLGEEKVVWL
jgi:ankyrin repeat protein